MTDENEISALFHLHADALIAARRPGAAALLCAVAGLIVADNVPDRELMALGHSLASAGLKKLQGSGTGSAP